LSDKAKLRAENDIASREEASRSALVPPEDLSADRSEDREGLPRTYRMRADRHYVDQLAAPVGGQPVRMLPVDQIDSEGSFSQTELRPLIESIRAHGLVHPLLVRSRGPRYAVVAGRRRLAAAQILALTSVPCLVHELDDTQAAALAAADNLATGSNSQRTEASPLPWAVRQIVAEHLAAIRTCTGLVAGSLLAMNKSVVEMIRAHAWRAACLGDALDLIQDTVPPPGRGRTLSAIADEVIEGFRAEGRLNDFIIRAVIRDDLLLSGVNDRELLAGLSGAVLATLPLVEHAVRPTVWSKSAAGASDAGTVVLEVVQSDASVSGGLARYYFDDEAPHVRPGGSAAVAGAKAAKALAERYGGTATFDVLPNGGTALRMIFARR
jgi:hypothetical protein